MVVVRRRSGTCVFCGEQRSYSREHVIPRWVRKQVFTTGPVTVTRGSSAERIRYDETLTLTVTDAVCRDCNTGWLRQIGDRVASDAGAAMRGEHLVLTAKRAQVLAAWAVERALLFELALKDELAEAWYAPASNLRWLHRNALAPSPPPGAQVFMGYLRAPESLPAWHVTGSYPAGEDKRGYVVSFSIGHLVLVVFGQDFLEPDLIAPDGDVLGRFELPGHYAGFLVPLWPDPASLVVWPPRRHLDRAELPGFADWTQAQFVRVKAIPVRDA